jgi:hypothetical protein
MIVRLIILGGRKAGVTKREKKENHEAEKPKNARVVVVVDANKLIR